MIDPPASRRDTAVRWADLPRTVAALFIAGTLGPVLFIALDLLWAAAIAKEQLSLSSSDPLSELFGLGVLVMILGCPASIGVAAVIGLPCIYLARRLRLTSSWTFAFGGSGLALCCTAGFARGDVKGFAEWLPFAATMAVTGACCGLICWWIAERPTQRPSK